MNQSADIFTEIVPNVEYVPVDGHSVIYQIHCIKSNTCPVKIWSYVTANNGLIEFPPGAFVQGAVYPLIVLKMEFDPEHAGFIGYSSSVSNHMNSSIPKGWLSRYEENKKKNTLRNG